MDGSEKMRPTEEEITRLQKLVTNEAVRDHIIPYLLRRHSSGCKEEECSFCGVLECPHENPLHFHRDGCPACRPRLETPQ